MKYWGFFYRWNLYAPTQSIRKLSAEANSPPQYTENELKLCSEIETLTKETDALKEKCATLDVSSTHTTSVLWRLKGVMRISEDCIITNYAHHHYYCAVS